MINEAVVHLAEKIAREAHQGQYRRGGVVSYIEHPKAVVDRVGADPEARVVAWLHDVLEDTEVTAAELSERGIPSTCIDAIVLMTKTKEVSYEEYLENVASSPLATHVKIADMISNLSDAPSTGQLKKYSKGLMRLTRDL
jgi:(p)ppGpp synthase/HD superfamily hydrolase